MTDFPADADGDALRRVVADGNDLSQPMQVDFPVVFDSLEATPEFVEAARSRGYDVEIGELDDEADEGEKIDVFCVKTMLLTYDAVIACQNELNELSKPYGGFCDGWGTFGNVEGAEE
ncbi:ribonuclease E inhibitor RraB [Anatilimnocola sp. NA78]|uniref:ribonuclease E inhibitor RraB n=1 Tax=Anatilimnocola sp. NA78 TaxID=3415683 RepID=UPI003CE59D6A